MMLSVESILIMVVIIGIAAFVVYIITDVYGTTLSKINNIANSRENRQLELIYMVDVDNMVNDDTGKEERRIILNRDNDRDIEFIETWSVNGQMVNATLCHKHSERHDYKIKWCRSESPNPSCTDDPQSLDCCVSRNELIQLSCMIDKEEDLVLVTSNYKTIEISGIDP